ncbi:hypothetical protein FAZ95_19155 [Trinickia violacea]|uniref:Uncharacterized protein n=1 Tax=Trinickia violacea TaxID=2571746 RepID=A0A4V1EHQ4_9BURK|nr:hypothetical protein FAZ95_19155 [Trinickia violacea]
MQRHRGRRIARQILSHLAARTLLQIGPSWCMAVRKTRYLFIIKAILKDSKVVVCWIVKAFARTSASSS